MALLAFIGTQGEAAGEGIVAVTLDEETGALTLTGTVAEEERPTFTYPDRARPVLFAVSEVGNRDERCGAIMSYQIADVSGNLRPLARRRTGGGPTHLEMSGDGRMLYCANFGGPQAVGVPVESDGLLSPISALVETHGTGPHKRQTKPHPHGVTLDPSGRFLLVPDMGADRIFIYEVPGEELIATDPAFLQFPAGCGPRFVLFGKGGTSAYMLGELSAHIFHLGWDADTGTLSTLAQIAMDPPDAEHAPGAAAFDLSPDGRFLYVSNRGTNEMQVYQVDPDTGALTEIQRTDCGGIRPWGAGLSEDGKWLIVANQGSDCINLFAVDGDSGLLSLTDHSLTIGKPTSAAFVSKQVLAQLS